MPCAFADLASSIGQVGFALTFYPLPPNPCIFLSLLHYSIVSAVRWRFIALAFDGHSICYYCYLIFYKTFLNIKAAMGSSLIAKYLSRQKVYFVSLFRPIKPSYR